MERVQGMLPATSSGQKITFKIIFSYFFDYAIIAILAIIWAVLDKIVTPFAQPFSVTNISLMYPMADPERVPIWVAMVYSCLCPAIIIAIYTLLLDGMFSKSKSSLNRTQRYTWGDRLWELNCGILGLFLAQGAAFVITGSLKNLIGKPRPDLLFRCNLPRNTTDPSFPSFGLTNRTECRQEDHAILQDGFRSFPSGHSSSSFAGLFYLSLYLAAKLHVLDQRGEVWRTFIVLIPTLAASLIAGSRIIDARHHPFDVMFGSALGILCGWAAYRQYFPPVSHTWEKGRAYPMRTWGVPLRRPDGIVGTDGRMYNKYDRTVHPMMNEDDSDAQQSMLGTNMEPVRAGYGSSAMPAPSFQQFQQRGPSPGLRSRGSDDDTDYEHVRLKAGSTSAMPVESIGRTERVASPPVGANSFREQVERNQNLREGGDEQDLAYQRPLK